MGLLWENFARQMDSVRSTRTDQPSIDAFSGTDSLDEPGDRRRRLEKALEAIQGSGNAMMIESLKAAIEGRQADLNLPDLPEGIAKF